MNNKPSSLEFQAIKNHYKTNALGELRIKQGDQMTLVDEGAIFVKVQLNGRIGFAPLYCLNGIEDKNLRATEKTIFMVHHQNEANLPDEASIEVGQLVQVKVIADDGWCFGKSNNNSGWFPLNHLTPLFSKLISDAEKLPGYVGKLSISACRSLASNGLQGDYLIRLREDNKSFCLMVETPEGLKSFIIELNSEGHLALGPYSANTLSELLKNYNKIPITICKDGTEIILKTPLEMKKASSLL